MSDERYRGEPESAADRPLAALSGASEEPDDRFVPVLRARINRRLLAADTVDFSLQVFFATLLDYVDLAVASLLGLTRRHR